MKRAQLRANFVPAYQNQGQIRMALAIHEYLYRFRFQWDLEGSPVLAETVKKAAVLNNGEVSAQSDSELKTVTASKLKPEMDALLARFDVIWEEEKAEKAAEEARKAAEVAEAIRLAEEAAAVPKA
jgi:hypothetical protein